MTIDGVSSFVVGLNQIGLRRAGFDLEAIRQLKAAYRVIYRSGLPWAEVLRQLKAEFAEGPAADFYAFLSTTTRGIVQERRSPPGATIKIRDTVEEERQPSRCPSCGSRPCEGPEGRQSIAQGVSPGNVDITTTDKAPKGRQTALPPLRDPRSRSQGAPVFPRRSAASKLGLCCPPNSPATA